MTDMSWEHADEARAALNAIMTDPEHGAAALSSPQTMSNLLKDLLPDAPREKSLLVAAAEAGLANTLRDHVAQGMDPDTATRLAASSLAVSTPFTPEACNWVTSEIAIALGISQPTDSAAQAASGAAGTGTAQATPRLRARAGRSPGQSISRQRRRLRPGARLRALRPGRLSGAGLRPRRQGSRAPAGRVREPPGTGRISGSPQGQASRASPRRTTSSNPRVGVRVPAGPPGTRQGAAGRQG